jgi:hypothetical protein
MNVAALHKMADMLDGIPAQEFNLNRWGEDIRPGFIRRMLGHSECGFAGCAMGWAAHMKTFDGLTLDADYYSDGYGILYADKDHPEITYDGYVAAAKLFNISVTVAAFFFSPASYTQRRVKPSDVANRIREYCQIYEYSQTYSKNKETTIKQTDISDLQKLTDVRSHETETV